MDAVRPEFERAFHQTADAVEGAGHKPIAVWYRLRDDGWLPQSYEEGLLLAHYLGYADGWGWHLFQQSLGAEERKPGLWGEPQTSGTSTRAKQKARTYQQRQTYQGNRQQQRQQQQKQRPGPGKAASSAPAVPPEAQLLGLSVWPVPEAELKRAYRLRAKQTHPDVGGDAHAFRAVTDAYERLRGRVC